MNNARNIIWVLVAVLIMGIGLFTYLNYSETKAGAKLQPMEISGTIEAEEIDVNVKVPGRVLRIDVEEGDSVLEGQVIAELEAENIAAKERLAQAALEAATAQYNKAKKGARPQQVEQAKNLMDQAKAGYQLAKSNFERLEMLYREGVLPEQKLDVARTELEVAKTRYNSAAEQYDLVKEGAQQEDLQAAAALVRQAEAACAEVRSYLKDAVVTAPIAGIISMKTVQKGELVSTGMPLVTICNLKHVWLEVKIRETAIGRFKIGQKLPVRVIGIPEVIYQGEITSIASKPSFATERAYQEKGERDLVAFGVKIDLENFDLKLRPGMTAVINI